MSDTTKLVLMIAVVVVGLSVAVWAIGGAS
jgi:hypothetical protein